MAPLDRLTRPARYGVQLAGAAWPLFLRPLMLELASRRPIREVLPGVYHWTAIHPRIRLPVDSYYIEPRAGCPRPGGAARGSRVVRAASDPGPDRLTKRHHLRHSERYAEAFGCPIRCSDAGLHEVERGSKVEGFAFGEELAPGITAQAMWDPASGVFLIALVIVFVAGQGTDRARPGSWLRVPARSGDLAPGPPTAHAGALPSAAPPVGGRGDGPHLRTERCCQSLRIVRRS
jgi:hypothetical protein